MPAGTPLSTASWMMAGTLSLQGIVVSQSQFHLFGTDLVVPFKRATYERVVKEFSRFAAAR